MIFAQEVLAPGPGNQSKSTFRWSPFQSALSGSLLFMPPALPEVFDLKIRNRQSVATCSPSLFGKWV